MERDCDVNDGANSRIDHLDTDGSDNLSDGCDENSDADGVNTNAANDDSCSCDGHRDSL